MLPNKEVSKPSRLESAEVEEPDTIGESRIPDATLTSSGADTEDTEDEADEIEAEVPVDDADEFIEEDGEIEPVEAGSEEDDLLILSPLSDEFDEKVAEAQEQLLHLRHQQEQLEKQKAELEELKRKRKKFLRGRGEATDRLTKAMTMLEREMFEAQKRLGQFAHARDAFARHLKNLEEIDPESWARDETRSELTRALAAIQDARDEYTTEMARIGAIADVSSHDQEPVPLPVEVRSEKVEAPERQEKAAGASVGRAVTSLVEARDFMYWLKSGFAFTLPLLIFGIFALFLLLVVF
ncbi:MAG: hypothetical protein ACR2RV_12920 [Verrucomicrobiales bacterium]